MQEPMTAKQLEQWEKQLDPVRSRLMGAILRHLARNKGTADRSDMYKLLANSNDELDLFDTVIETLDDWHLIRFDQETPGLVHCDGMKQAEREWAAQRRRNEIRANLASIKPAGGVQ